MEEDESINNEAVEVETKTSVPNPILEFDGPVKLKRGRPPKMRRELQVSLSHLSLSCTQRLMERKCGTATTLPTKPSGSPIKVKRLSKRGRPPKLQNKIRFSFLPSKGESSSKTDGKSSGSNSIADKDSRENSDHNSASADEKNQQEEQAEDMNWADDFGFYRPIRAAAAAALEAVQVRKSQDELIRLRLRNKVFSKQPPPKGRNRRTVLRRATGQTATKGITSRATAMTSQSIFHRGVYYQEGDIVKINGDDDEEYYCQIVSVMRDFKFIACASLRWLIPKPGLRQSLIPFSPSNFKVYDGVPEQIISLDCVEFVMHCPHDYYFEHPVSFFQPVKGTVYMRLGEQLVSVEKVPLVPKSASNDPAESLESSTNLDVPSS